MDFKKEISGATSLKDLEKLEIKYLGRQGIVNNLLAKIKDVPAADKKEYGAKINKQKLEKKELV